MKEIKKKISSKKPKKHPAKTGMTLLELLVVTILLTMVWTIIVPTFSAFFDRARITHNVRKVTIALNTARYQAIWLNRKIKVDYDPTNHSIALKKKINSRWRNYKYFSIHPDVSVSFNRGPVFSPTGTAAPLCSIYITYKDYRYKITISMAGKVTKYTL